MKRSKGLLSKQTEYTCIMKKTQLPGMVLKVKTTVVLREDATSLPCLYLLTYQHIEMPTSMITAFPGFGQFSAQTLLEHHLFKFHPSLQPGHGFASFFTTS